MFRSGTPLFAQYAPQPLDDVAVPPFPEQEADADGPTEDSLRDFDFEIERHDWHPIAPSEAPPDAPVRFIDGSIATRTVGLLNVDGRRRPLIAATISAASLQIEGRTTRRTGLLTSKVLCLNSNGIDPSVLAEAYAALDDIGIELRLSETEDPSDFDSMRRSSHAIAMTAMEEAERDVMLQDVETPTLVDGLLERRLRGTRHDVPVVGLVKRQLATYLPMDLQELAYSLRPGERTPAFMLRTVQHVDIVNCYVRLSELKGASPSYGIVRMTVSLDYLLRHHPRFATGPESMSAHLSGLAGYIYRLRHRDLAYERAGISIEPIVRVEEHLHAVRPRLDALVYKLHAFLRPAAAEVTYGRI